MNIRQQINKSINKIQRNNKSRTDAYKKRLKEQIRVNIQEKGQSIDSNQVLVNRFYDAKEQPLTQMQTALLEAIQ